MGADRGGDLPREFGPTALPGTVPGQDRRSARLPLTLVGETQLRLLSKTRPKPRPSSSQSGRILVDGSAPGRPHEGGFRRHTADHRPEDGRVLGDRTARFLAIRPDRDSAPSLAIHALDGELTVAMDRGQGDVARARDAPGRSRREAPVEAREVGSILGQRDRTVPKDQKLGEQFLKQFSKDRPVLADIVAATEDESPVTKKLAIYAVKALGDLSLLTPILSRAGDPDARQSTAAALRDCLAQGPQAEKALRDQLNEEFGEENGQTVLKLLIGYSQDEASKSETFRKLVELLSPRNPSLPSRELALENLKTLYGPGRSGL